MQIIQSSPRIRVTNLDHLPRGTGAKYLEVLTPHQDGLAFIAIKWRRKLPEALPNGRALIRFGGRHE
jgi:hypothetical protein